MYELTNTVLRAEYKIFCTQRGSKRFKGYSVIGNAKNPQQQTKKSMKHILALLMLFTVAWTYAQSNFPDFLHGTWKMENKEAYEHWDKLNENTLKGFSYKLKDGQMLISEYLDIRKDGKNIIYSATVLKQNSGNAVDFTLT